MVRVLLFSVLKERLGTSLVELDLSESVTTGELLSVLAARFEAIAEYRASVRLAVNGTYAAPETMVHPGDEVAVITPVSGG